MEEMDKKEIKDVIEWCDEKGHSEHEILELIRRNVGAYPREEEKQYKDKTGQLHLTFCPVFTILFR